MVQFSFQSQRRAMPKECSNCHTIVLISYARKVMLKILQAWLHEYVNQELPDVQAGFRKGKGTRDHISNICLISEKVRGFQQNIYFCFIDYGKAFDCVYHNKLWKILQEVEITDHITYFFRSLHSGQEATIEPDMGQQTGSKLGKEYGKVIYGHPSDLTSMQST